METLKLTKNHWSFKLISLIYDGGDVEWQIGRGRVDSCEYNKMIFWSSLWVCVLSAFVLMTAFSATFFSILSIITLINTSVPWFLVIGSSAAILGLVGFNFLAFLWGLVAVLTPVLFCSVIGFVYLLAKMVDRRPKISLPTKTQELFESWKEKYCKQIEFE